MNFNQIKNEYNATPLTRLSLERKERLLDMGFKVSQTKEENTFLYQEYRALAEWVGSVGSSGRYGMFAHSNQITTLMRKAQACYDLSMGRFTIQGPKVW
jgi:hypothetical protein